MNELPKNNVASTPYLQQDGSIKDGKEYSIWPEVRRVVAATRRQAWAVVYSVMLTSIIGLVYVAITTPKYTATTEILIDSRKTQDQLSAQIADLTVDTSAVDSQVEVMKSTNVALSVVIALALDGDLPNLSTLQDHFPIFWESG